MHAAATKKDWIRLIAAIIISPAVPILTLAIVFWKGTGSKAWFPLFFIFGYLFFFLIGLPLVGILLKKRTVSSCAISGGIVSVLPILILGILSIFSPNTVFTGEMLANLFLLFLVGAMGGAVFWGIAFARLGAKIT